MNPGHGGSLPSHKPFADLAKESPMFESLSRMKVNARLILLLANHIGDISVLREAMSIARAGVASKD